MFRKTFALTIAGIVVGATMVAIPAQGATVVIANGVICPKLGATKKANNDTYMCFLNTVVNKKKPTWTTIDCVKTDKQWRASSASYKKLALEMPKTLAELDTQIAAELAKGVEAAAKADALQIQINEWRLKIVEFTKQQTSVTSARDQLVAKPSKTAQDTASIQKYNSAILSLTTAIRSLNSAIRGATAAQASLRKVGKTAATMQTTKAQAIQNLAQAKSGVAQSLNMRAIICQKGL